jgi:hypothetical protein
VFSGRIPDDSPSVIRIDADAKAVVAVGPDDDHETAIVLAKPIDTTHRFSIWTTAGQSASMLPTTQSIEISE